MPANPVSTRSWRTRVTSALTDRIGLKAVALLLAIILWFVVNAKEPTVELVPVRFVPVLDSSLVLRDPPPDIQALVAGAPQDLIRLASARLVIRRPISGDAPDTLLVDIAPADVTLPDVVAGRIQVQDVRPRSVTLRFETTAHRMVPVRAALVAPGTGVTLRVEPESVQVSGPRRAVTRVQSVQTIRGTLSGPDSLPHLVDLDTTPLAGLRLKPSQVKVTPVPPRARRP